MRQSQLFTKTRKTTPKEEESLNAKLLIRAGYIHKEMAGVYSYLPLGLRVFKKIEQIIREEMNAIGGQEIIMTALQEKDIWEKSERWSDKVVDIWFKTQLKNKTELGLAYTHEAPITAIMKDHIASYRDLPKYVYQFQTKFRNELRAKSGLFRGREFTMKDMYSFSATEKDLDDFYDKKVIPAYRNIFNRAGIGELTYKTKASGGTFSASGSTEFQTITPAGEDMIYITDEDKKEAINTEWLEEQKETSRGRKEKAVEVGNIFKLGTHFSEKLGLFFADETSTKRPVIMGSYGIGLGRLMGTIVEVLADEKGIIWPEEVAPYAVHLIELPGGEKDAKKLYEELSEKGIEVLYDDRENQSAGEKLADADLIGIPWRIVVSRKTAAQGVVEVKKRNEENVELMDIKAALERFKS